MLTELHVKTRFRNCFLYCVTSEFTLKCDALKAFKWPVNFKVIEYRLQTLRFQKLTANSVIIHPLWTQLIFPNIYQNI